MIGKTAIQARCFIIRERRHDVPSSAGIDTRFFRRTGADRSPAPGSEHVLEARVADVRWSRQRKSLGSKQRRTARRPQYSVIG